MPEAGTPTLNPAAGQFGGVGGGHLHRRLGRRPVRSSVQQPLLAEQHTASRTAGRRHPYATCTPAAPGMTIESSTVGGSACQNGGAITIRTANGAPSRSRGSIVLEQHHAQAGRGLWLLRASPTSISGSKSHRELGDGHRAQQRQLGPGRRHLISANNSVTISHAPSRRQPRRLGGRRHHRRHGLQHHDAARHDRGRNTASNGGNPGTSRTTARPAARRRRQPAVPDHARPGRSQAIPTAPRSSPSAIRCWHRSRTTAGPRRRARCRRESARNRVTTGCPPPLHGPEGSRRLRAAPATRGACEAAPVRRRGQPVGERRGPAGSASACSTSRCPEANTLPVTVSYATANGTAVAGSDYLDLGRPHVRRGRTRLDGCPLPVATAQLDEDDRDVLVLAHRRASQTPRWAAAGTATRPSWTTRAAPHKLGARDCA